LTVVQTQYGYHFIKIEDHKLAHVRHLTRRVRISSKLCAIAPAAGSVPQAIGKTRDALSGKGLEPTGQQARTRPREDPDCWPPMKARPASDPSLLRDAFKLNPNDVRSSTAATRSNREAHRAQAELSAQAGRERAEGSRHIGAPDARPSAGAAAPCLSS